MIGPQTTLILQRYTETSDLMGGFLKAWATVSSVTGFLEQISGDERLDALKRSVVSSHIFITEAFSTGDISPKDRFTYGSRVFTVVAVKDPSCAGYWLEIKLLENV